MTEQLAKILCIKHPKYTGIGSPDLSCRVCCAKFVEKIRIKQQLEINKSLDRLKTILENGSKHD